METGAVRTRGGDGSLGWPRRCEAARGVETGHAGDVSEAALSAELGGPRQWAEVTKAGLCGAELSDGRPKRARPWPQWD